MSSDNAPTKRTRYIPLRTELLSTTGFSLYATEWADTPKAR